VNEFVALKITLNTLQEAYLDAIVTSGFNVIVRKYCYINDFSKNIKIPLHQAHYLECKVRFLLVSFLTLIDHSRIKWDTIKIYRAVFPSTICAGNCVENFASKIFSGKFCNCDQPCVEKIYKSTPTISKVMKIFDMCRFYHFYCFFSRELVSKQSKAFLVN